MPATLLGDDAFASHEPASGTPVSRFPIDDEAAVAAAVARAREGASWWAGLGTRERRARLLAWKALLAQRAEEIVTLVRRETGKPRSDAMVELLLGLDRLDWSARHAARELAGQRRRPSLISLNQRLRVTRVPKGVVGAITPWNFPLFIALQTFASALAAGNAVVHKPSEHTPAVGHWLADTLGEVTPEQSIMEVVTGFGETGAALCRSGVDHLAFTGSPETGRAVMATCASTLTPVTLELGGVDAAIVDHDADVERAARGVVYPALLNAGQMCIGVERAYVARPVAQRFREAVVDRVQRLSAGADEDAAYGPMTIPAQVEVVRDHLEDALARGARPLVGGREAIRPPFVDPIVLTDVPAEARLLQEETFGPLAPLFRFDTEEEAIEQANATIFGLAAYFYARDLGRVTRVQEGLEYGIVGVNTGIISTEVAPFGGVKQSGLGREGSRHGIEDYLEMKYICTSV